MARLSDQLIGGLAQPGFQKGMFTAGQAVGQLPSMLRQKKRQDQLAKFNPNTLDGLKNILQTQMSQGDAAGAAKTAKAIQQFQANQEALRSQRASTRATEDATSAAQSQRLSDINQLSNIQRAVYAKAQRENNQNIMDAAYAIPLDEGVEYILGDLDDPTISKGTEVNLRDSKGNTYTSVVVYEDGKPTRKLIPQPGAPETPVGEVEIISGTTGASAFDKPGIAGATALSTQFNERRVAAVEKLADMQYTKNSIKEAIRILDNEELKPGGFTAGAARSIASFLGSEPETLGEFETILGEVVLQKLDAFTGAISEGERQFLIEMVGGYRQSSESNIGRLKTILRKLEFNLDDSINVATSKTYDDYIQTLIPKKKEEQTELNLSWIPEDRREDARAALNEGGVTIEELEGMYKK